MYNIRVCVFYDLNSSREITLSGTCGNVLVFVEKVILKRTSSFLAKISYSLGDHKEGHPHHWGGGGGGGESLVTPPFL